MLSGKRDMFAFFSHLCVLLIVGGDSHLTVKLLGYRFSRVRLVGGSEMKILQLIMNIILTW